MLLPSIKYVKKLIPESITFTSNTKNEYSSMQFLTCINGIASCLKIEAIPSAASMECLKKEWQTKLFTDQQIVYKLDNTASVQTPNYTKTQ